MTSMFSVLWWSTKWNRQKNPLCNVYILLHEFRVFLTDFIRWIGFQKWVAFEFWFNKFLISFWYAVVMWCYFYQSCFLLLLAMWNKFIKTSQLENNSRLMNLFSCHLNIYIYFSFPIFYMLLIYQFLECKIKINLFLKKKIVWTYVGSINRIIDKTIGLGEKIRFWVTLSIPILLFPRFQILLCFLIHWWD